MNKSFRFYALIWVILLAAFNAVIFLMRPVIPGLVINYDARFWIAWVFIIVSFIGNLVCAQFAFKAENLHKMFYNLSLITVSWTALIAMCVAGSILMLVPDFPAWFASIVCILILAFSAIAVTKATWAAETVMDIDEGIKTQTAFIKDMTVRAESILVRAKSNEVKAECKKVYEAVRYSDPMSNEGLMEIEAKITVKVGELSSCVDNDEIEKVRGIGEEIITLIDDRNRKCRAMK